MANTDPKPRALQLSVHTESWNRFIPGWQVADNRFPSWTWTDQVTIYGEMPKWRQVISMGGNATTHFAARRTTIEAKDGMSVYTAYTGLPRSGSSNRSSWFVGNYSNVAIPGSAVDDLSDPAENSARMYFYKDLQDKMTAFQSGIFLGELREALSMIRNPAKAFRNGVDRYLDIVKKRCRRRSRTDKERILADTWLEYSFGWSPLIGDIRRGSQYLEIALEHQATDIVRIRGVGKSGSVAYLPGSSNYSAGFVTFTWKTRETSERIVKYYGGVHSQAVNPKTMHKNLLGFKLEEFVPTLWELMPWSFMIDYFTNIGDVIVAASYQRTALAWAARTFRGSNTRLMEHQATTFSPFAIVDRKSASPAEFKATTTSVSRQPVSEVPIPSITFEVPGFGTKWLNIAALVKARHTRL